MNTEQMIADLINAVKDVSEDCSVAASNAFDISIATAERHLLSQGWMQNGIDGHWQTGD